MWIQDALNSEFRKVVLPIAISFVSNSNDLNYSYPSILLTKARGAFKREETWGFPEKSNVHYQYAMTRIVFYELYALWTTTFTKEYIYTLSSLQYAIGTRASVLGKVTVVR